MGSVKGFNYNSKLSGIDNVGNNNNKESHNIIKNVAEELDLDIFDVDKSDMTASLGIFGHKDKETLDYVELKKDKKLKNMDKYSNLEDLLLNNCDLKDSSDLELIPDTVENIDFLYCDIDDYSYLNNKNNLERIGIEASDSEIDLDQFGNKNVGMFSLVGAKGDITGDLGSMPNLECVNISFTNIDNFDFMKNNDKITDLELMYDLISDVSPLYDSNIEYLNIEGNSVNHLDISRFPNLKSIDIKGNYNLYTQEMLDYCKLHDISIDIDQEDVNEINILRDIIDSLDLEGKSDLEKESIIYSYVLKNLTYEKKVAKESNEEPIKTALTGEGVCAAYSAFFKALCNVADINAYESMGRGKGLVFGGSHGWNLIEIDNQYYLCDPTWSDTVREGSILDHRHLSYKIKSLWNRIFGDDELEVDDKYYNVSGDKAKSFMKHHKESLPYEEYVKEKHDILYRDEKALDVVSVDTSTSDAQKVAIDTAMASAFPGVSGIKEFPNELANKLIDIFSS